MAQHSHKKRIPGGDVPANDAHDETRPHLLIATTTPESTAHDQSRLPGRSSPPPEFTSSELPYAMDESSLGLDAYWKMLVKHRRVAAAVFLAIVALGSIWTYTKTPLYTATAVLRIEPQAVAILRIEDRVQQATTDSMLYDYYKTQFALLQGRSLAAGVIRDLQLERVSAFAGNDQPGVLRRFRDGLQHTVNGTLASVFSVLPAASPTPARSPAPEHFTFAVAPPVIDRYLSLLEVKPINGTRLVQIAFTTREPALSHQLANAHATAFIRNALASRFELTKEAREFLGAKLSELRAKVEQADEALTRFRNAHGVTSLEGNENIEVERLVELNRRLTEARAKRIELESLYRMVAKQDARSLSLVMASSVIQQIKTSLGTIEAERARLSATFTPSHPRLIELGTQIAELRRRLEREMAAVVSTVESDFAAAREREQDLENEIARQQQIALASKQQEANYRFLKQEADSSRALYETVLKRLQETSVWNESSVSNIEMSEPAELPLSPSFPQRNRDFTLTLLAAMLTVGGVVFGAERLNSTVRTPDDVWRVAATRTLGIVPQRQALPSPGARDLQFPTRVLHRVLPARFFATPTVAPQDLVMQQSHSTFTEFYRNICAGLLFANEGHAPQVVLVTSAHPGDGKTVSTVNLAITLAQSGHSAVVVDADLRRGSCHTFLRQPNPLGLSDILSGTSSLEDSLQTTRVPGLSLLSRGRIAPNPVRLLSSRHLKRVIETLRGAFDFVLIDSPPALAMSDAAIVSQVCDGVVLVVRGQHTPLDAARRVVERLESFHCTVLGVVLNGIDLDDPDYADYVYPYTERDLWRSPSPRDRRV